MASAVLPRLELEGMVASWRRREEHGKDGFGWLGEQF